MDSAGSCTEIRPLLAEFAIGAVGGHERARVVHHIASCPACSRGLAELTKVSDGLLLLAPAAEPPPGFESAVVARMATAGARPAGKPVRPAHRPRRLLALAAAALAAALAGGATGAGVTRAQGADDRALAERYRQVLAVANGQYLRALRLTTDSGAAAGTVFLYQGRPSWMLVSVTSAPQDGRYEMDVIDDAGAGHDVGVCRVAQGTGTSGYQLPGRITDIAEIILDGPGGARLSARTR